MLVAIAIPVFNASLEKAKDATDQANIRAAYASVAVGIIDGTITGSTSDVDIEIKGTNNKWVNTEDNSFKIGNMEIAAKSGATKIQFDYTADGGITSVSLKAS